MSLGSATGEPHGWKKQWHLAHAEFQHWSLKQCVCDYIPTSPRRFVAFWENQGTPSGERKVSGNSWAWKQSRYLKSLYRSQPFLNQRGPCRIHSSPCLLSTGQLFKGHFPSYNCFPFATTNVDLGILFWRSFQRDLCSQGSQVCWSCSSGSHGSSHYCLHRR